MLLISMFVVFSCKHTEQPGQAVDTVGMDEVSMTEMDTTNGAHTITDKFGDLDTSEWMDMTAHLKYAEFDIKYASEDNFMEQVVYDCPACFMRKNAGKAIVVAELLLADMGYGLVIYDCYRPAKYQQRLWDIMPDKRYVAPPEKGSNHGRGTAIDLTLYDMTTRKVLDMGTDFDYFGREAHPGYPNHSDQVNRNRSILTTIMQETGFAPITSEWWHFDFTGPKQPLSDALWHCD